MAVEHVVVVDELGQVLGTQEKMAAHRSGVLHRAFSIFVFNSRGQLMLQQRALHKYHSGGLWTNTCCSHPRLHETFKQGAVRRLQEEMGLECELTEVFQFTYRAELDQGMIEHEFDQVLFGITDQLPKLNPEEAASFRFISLDELDQQMAQQPQQFTAWFQIAYQQVRQHWLAMTVAA
ncbi:isopentenyl-diphosphate Delta-isomerase [Ferrimonas senticii]|uniref:isopentenyl-diphosphate Delta-isomerase n=1 Tax=Ferrimonas senticii TaxID=394566 RepID=UPI0004813F49|nr:isopentenyl-diphosphate Delta-isomerase [Ferrimonas senticii]